MNFCWIGLQPPATGEGELDATLAISDYAAETSNKFGSIFAVRLRGRLKSDRKVSSHYRFK